MWACIHKQQTHRMLTYLILVFFQAIQSFNNAAPKNEEELIQSVQDAYNNYLRKRLNWTWLTLQSVFNQIILCSGDNDYNIELFEYEPK